ncbi:ent-kaurenoic acid oxidase 1-like [Mercurialis annua]|uniref:ent-kaurenoic acid oxidase 1-like n=1 Tax=Mercurialis annua TaxID=3986 RepID=UPI00215E297C|nr:ent-kaurenoic acid oxidase 1-like [Mercurialis annua]
MEIWVVAIWVAAALGCLKWVLKRANGWLYESHLGEMRRSLPPGDLGWPFIGNMWSFLRAFKSGDPEFFMRNIATRYGDGGVYKAFMFAKPSVLVTSAEACKRVLTDDKAFKPGWPSSAVELIGKKSFVTMSYEDHKRLRRLTAAPVNGHEALSLYLHYIEDNFKSALEQWCTMGEFEFLTHLRKITFRIIMYIFLSSESHSVVEALETEYTALNHGMRAMAINLPGFAYHKALKARKNLVCVLQIVVNARREEKKEKRRSKDDDMLDRLLDVEDENSRKMSNEEIIDLLLMYLNAGHESFAHVTMWATVFLQEHPQCFRKAKQEQLEIVKRRPSTQTGLSLKEVREMDYLSKVIDETLRLINISLTVFREAKSDVNINGYVIPRGWRILVWFRSLHFDPKIFPNPKEFNPSRWDNHTAKAGTFLPFGAGSRLCPGNDLVKLEISIFLHHFLLNYQLERLNPQSSIMYLPHSRPKDNCLARIKKIQNHV